MIGIENSQVFGWEAAIRGMRNPLNSWNKSDSGWKEIILDGHFDGVEYIIGEDDLDLMKRLVDAGSDHSKFMRMINVTVDITAPLYWWKEFDTYRIGVEKNSCSTMHKIHSRDLSLDDFSHEHLNGLYLEQLRLTIDCINNARMEYLDTKDKFYWWQMIQLLPTSYNQRRTVQLNYAVLRNIYNARRNHKLDEWHTFCEYIEDLPYSELITE